jgi:hypothetical protein
MKNFIIHGISFFIPISGKEDGDQEMEEMEKE